MERALFLIKKSWVVVVLLLLCPAMVWSDDMDIYTYKKSACISSSQQVHHSSMVSNIVMSNSHNDTRYMDELFMTLFGIDEAGRGYGNVKKLVLYDAKGNGITEVLDVKNLALALDGRDYTSAINLVSGNIKRDALTFWTLPEFLPEFLSGILPDDLQYDEWPGSDGDSVRRGGAGQLMPQFITGMIDYTNTTTSRKIYTENNDGSGLMAFDANDKNAADFYPFFKLDISGKSMPDQLMAMIKLPATISKSEEKIQFGKALMHYVRGVDIADSVYSPLTTSGPARDWILGDIIHSTPLILNYGNISGRAGIDKPFISIIFGANDGMIHFLENTDTNGHESGEELYAFLPRELLRIIPDRVKPPVDSRSHVYGMDGKVTALVFDDSPASGNIPDVIDSNVVGVDDFAYIYAGMRRGGKSYYALDVTDPLAPPVFLGNINKTQHDFAELGLTFSNAVPALVKFDNNVTPVLIFAGGYDVHKDDFNNLDASGLQVDPNNKGRKDDTGFYDNTHGKTPDEEGNAIYMVDALTLKLIWKSTNNHLNGSTNQHYYQKDLDYAIPSTVKPVDSNGDGFMDRMYVGDLAGNVWRGDFPECGVKWSCSDSDHRRNHWSLSRLAAFATASASGDARFFHPPAVVFTSDKAGDYDGIVIGSGDRENPLEQTDRNRVYMIKDRHTVSGEYKVNVLGLDDLADVSRCVVGNESGCEKLLSAKSLANGWRMDLAAMNSTHGSEGVPLVKGEKVLSQPLVIAGKIYLTTYIPAVAAIPEVENCQPAQSMASLYYIDMKDGTAANSNAVRYIKLGDHIAGDVIVAGKSILLPDAVPLDFMRADEEKSDYLEVRGKKSSTVDNPVISFLPASPGSSEYTYWHENDINDF